VHTCRSACEEKPRDVRDQSLRDNHMLVSFPKCKRVFGKCLVAFLMACLLSSLGFYPMVLSLVVFLLLSAEL